jgi:putative ABC transport system permease protein
LITGAGLMMRSFASVQQLDLGFDSERILSITVRPPESTYSDEELKQYVNRAVEELEAMPGVTSASATLYIPLNNETSTPQFVPSEQAGMPALEWPTAVSNRAYPGYFETMGIPLMAGRDFNAADGPEGARVAVVNEALAARYWPNQEAVGRTILVGNPTSPTTYSVVGVVGGVMHEAISGNNDRAQLYLPAAQSSFRRHFLVARTEGEPSAIISQARSTLLAIDPDLPLSFRPISNVVGQSQLQWSMGSGFLTVFGGGALLLAALGIYGLISYSVSQRERELGVRIAMGATVGEIRSIVVGDGLKLTGIGLGVGMVASLALGPFLAAGLFGVSPFDPVTLVGVMTLFAVVAALASFIPAQRAASTDPISVLRSE